MLLIIKSASSWAGDCGFDPYLRKLNINLNLYFRFLALVLRESAALSSLTQQATPLKFFEKWWLECPNTKFPLPTLVFAGYRMRLIYFSFLLIIILWLSGMGSYSSWFRSWCRFFNTISAGSWSFRLENDTRRAENTYHHTISAGWMSRTSLQGSWCHTVVHSCYSRRQRTHWGKRPL